MEGSQGRQILEINGGWKTKTMEIDARKSFFLNEVMPDAICPNEKENNLSGKARL